MSDALEAHVRSVAGKMRRRQDELVLEVRAAIDAGGDGCGVMVTHGPEGHLTVEASDDVPYNEVHERGTFSPHPLTGWSVE